MAGLMEGTALSRLVCIALVALLSFVHPAHSQTAGAPVDEVTALRIENAKLRAENQRLRDLLIRGMEAQRAAPAAPAAPAVPVQRSNLVPSTPAQRASGTADATLSHWMTSSSGKRHNSRCRWYGTTNGRKCGPSDGVACQKCGG